MTAIVISEREHYIALNIVGEFILSGDTKSEIISDLQKEGYGEIYFQ